MSSDKPELPEIPYAAVVGETEKLDDPTGGAPLKSKPPSSHRLSLFLSWAAILGVSLFMFVSVLYMQLNPDQTPSETGGMSLDLLQVNVAGKALIGQDQFVPLGSKALKQIEPFNAGPLAQRYAYSIMVNEFDGPTSALQALKDIDAAVEEHGYEPTEKENRLRQIIGQRLEQYESGDLDSSDMPEEDQQFVSATLGWTGELFLYPKETTNEADRKVLLQQAQMSVVLMGVFCVGIFLLVMTGFLAVVVFLFLISRNQLRAWFPPTTHHGYIYAETFAIWIVCFFGIQIGIGSIVEFLPDAIVGYITPIIFFASLVVLIWPLLRGVSFSKMRIDIGWELKNPFVEVGAGVAAYLATLPLLGAAFVVSALLASGLAMTQQQDEFSSAGGASHPIVDEFVAGDSNVIIIALLTACVAAPIVEETMFRGVLYRHLREFSVQKARWASVGLSVLLNSLIFASIHPQGLAGIPVLTAVAIGMSLAREWRGSLISSMTMHAIHNTLATCMMLLMFS